MKDTIIEALKNAAGHLTRSDLFQRLPNPTEQPSDDYWAAEQELVDQRLIERRRGRKGGIYLVGQPASPALSASEGVPARAVAQPEERSLESKHYEPALRTILTHWKEQPGFTHVFGAVIAGQGRRQTGGRWSRPDIVICTVSDWLFSSRPEGDVRTFEVKRFEALDVLAVYEALSHRAKAHYSYLLIVDFPKELNEDEKSDFENVLSVAARHGIGVITATNTADWSSWEFELDGLRSDADHQTIHQLVLDQVPRDVREAFRAALRTIRIFV